MPLVTCPQCQEQVEIEAGWYGRRVACPECQYKFTARRQNDDEPDEYRVGDAPDIDHRKDEQDLDTHSPYPPRRRRPRYDADDRPRSGNKVLWIVLGVIGGLLFLACAGCVGFLYYAGTAKVTFSGPWADQGVGPGDTPAVTASFPKPAVSEPLNDLAGGGVGSLVAYSNMDQDDSVKDAVVAVGYVEYPAGTANPLDKGYLPLREVLSERFVESPIGRPVVKKESATTVNGYPAKEAVYADMDGNFVLRVVHVNDRPRNAPVRLVVVLAGGSGLKDADREKFLQSVKIGKGR